MAILTEVFDEVFAPGKLCFPYAQTIYCQEAGHRTASRQHNKSERADPLKLALVPVPQWWTIGYAGVKFV